MVNKVFFENIAELENLFPHLKDTSEAPSDYEPSAEVVSSAQSHLSVYRDYNASLSPVQNEIQMLKKFMDLRGLTFKSDVTDLMDDGHLNVFEIYSLNYFQIYRSYSYFKFDTYSVLKLMNYSNFELYERPEEHIPGILADVQNSIENEKTIHFKAKEHCVWEKGKPDNYWFQKLGFVTPVYDRDNPEKPIAFFVAHKTTQMFKPLRAEGELPLAPR